MTKDVIEWQRLMKEAGDVIAAFSPASAPNEVKQRELDQAQRLMDEADQVFARIVATWLAAPVDPNTSRQ